MSLLSEFKEFAVRGNAIDMAVGVVIGGAFGKIVTSLVDNLIMPIVGLFIGGFDFTHLSIILKEASTGKEALVLNYGLLIQNIVDFVIIAFCIFMIIKIINRAKKPKVEEPVVEEISKETALLTEIRDLLKK